MSVSLKTFSQLSADDRDAWQGFQADNPMLGSPYFALKFFECVSQARVDTRVLCVYENGAPVGFLPMHVGFAGYARPLGGPLGDHCGLIAPAGGHIALQEALKAADVGVFDFVGALACQPSFAEHGRVRYGSWVIDLQDGYDSYLNRQASLQAKVFSKIRSRRRKIDQLSHVFRIHDTRPGIVDTALEWKREQYKVTGFFDVFSVEWTNKLIQSLSTIDTEHFAGSVSSLELDGQLAAIHVGMRSDRVLHYWFPVYNPKFSKLGPGLALLLEMAKAMSEDGVQAIDLGPGDYKFKAELSSYQFPIADGYVGAGLTYFARRLADQVEHGAEHLPLGRVSHWPGKAFRRIHHYTGFHP